MPPFSRKTPLAMKYVQLRRSNVPRAAAKKQAREFAEKYSKIKSIKEAEGIGSHDALLSTRRKEQQEKIARVFEKFTKHPISNEEANVVMNLYDYELSKKISKRMGKPYTFQQYCLDYAVQRFIKGVPKPKSNDEATAIMAQIGKMYGINFSEDTLSAASAAMEVGARKTTAPTTSYQFFREAERTNTLHKIENEQRIIMMELDQWIGSLDVDGTPFLRKLSTVIRELKSSPTEEEVKALARKIKGFNDKSEAAQKRIVQEKRAEEKLEPLIQAYVKHAEDLKQAIPLNQVNGWVLQSLKRPGNRRYLRTQLMEWFSKK